MMPLKISSKISARSKLHVMTLFRECNISVRCSCVGMLTVFGCAAGITGQMENNPRISFGLEGAGSLTSYNQSGSQLTNYNFRFQLLRDAGLWSIKVAYTESGTVEESVYDGKTCFALLHNGVVLTNFAGKQMPPFGWPTHHSEGLLHSDVSMAIVDNNERQPTSSGFAVRAVWLGTVPYGVDASGWKGPVVLPWSFPLPGGRVELSIANVTPEKVSPFPAHIKFATKNTEATFDGRPLRIPGVPPPPPDGLHVGDLEVTAWTNAGTLRVPTAWSITRVSLPGPQQKPFIQERYLLVAEAVMTSIPAIKSPAAPPLTSVLDRRVSKRTDVVVPIRYVLTNSDWPSESDPGLAAILSSTEPAALASLKAFAVAAPGVHRWPALLFFLCILIAPVGFFFLRKSNLRKTSTQDTQ